MKAGETSRAVGRLDQASDERPIARKRDVGAGRPPRGSEGAPCGDACGRDGQTLCLRCSAGDVCLDLFLPPPPGQPTNITHCYGEAGRVCECLLSEHPVFDCRPEANGQEVLYSPLVCAAVERQSRLDQGP